MINTVTRTTTRSLSVLYLIILPAGTIALSNLQIQFSALSCSNKIEILV